MQSLFRLFIVASLGLGWLAACGKKPTPNSSSLQSVSITLGTTPEPNGLYQAHTEGDGQTKEARVGDKDCQQLITKPGRTDAYLYLQANPAFKNRPLRHVTVTVEYFETMPTSFYLHYNSTAEGKDGAYTWSSDIKTKGLKEWQKAEIVLDNALFTGRQNSKADFRIVAKTSNEKQFYVRSVTLSEN